MKSRVAMILVASWAAAAAAADAHADVLFGSKHGSGNFCLNNNGGSMAVASCSNSGSQKFGFSGYGAISQGGKCLETAGEGRPLALRSCNNSTGQKWGMKGDGQLNNEQGWCADIQGASRNAGAAVIAWKCNGQSNQKWAQGRVVSVATLPQAAQNQIRNAQAGTGFQLRGGNIIAAGGGNIIAAGGGNIIAAGGGNAIAMGGR